MSARRLALAAPAKVNLYLEVRGRRPDGYHELVTVLQALELADEVEIALEESGTAGISLEVEDATGTRAARPVPAGPENLAWRAAARLLESAGLLDRLRVGLRLVKRIPAGGGLGGGSSDAAAVLAGLAELLDHPLDDAALDGLAAGLGSDVPFFLLPILGRGTTALGTGRGEHIQPIAGPADFELGLLVPPFGLSTTAVYAGLGGRTRPGPDVRASQWNQASAAQIEALYRNDLEPAARSLEPALERLLAHPRVHLCGSGSTLFTLDTGLARRLVREDPSICALSTRSRKR